MTDQVINWNNVYLQAIRLNGGAPGPIARTGAMLHAAIYDAVNSIEKTHKPYLEIIPANPGASKEAAAIYAAYTVLTSDIVYPNANFPKSKDKNNSFFDAERKKAIEELETSGVSLQSIGDGKELGIAAAQAIIQNRQGDGYNDNTPYTPGNQPGDWRPTGSGAPVTPNWGKVKPFSKTQIERFRPTRPAGFKTKQALLASVEYAAQVNEVKRLGFANSSDRTQEQTDIALFWANDLDGTYKPPGQLYSITQIVSKLKGLSFSENARLFALVGLGLGDAGILAWDAKYDTDLDLWRPESAIQLANTDGNPATIADPTWQPLSPNLDGTRFSPPFPAYVSGHATFGAIHAGILRNFFGTDNVTFTATSEDPAARGNNGIRITRTFNSFSSAALENGRSRVYLGVHYQWDADAAYVSGTKLADFVFENFLTPTSSAVSVTLKVSIQNLAPEKGTFLTPLWFGIHNGTFKIYEQGKSLANPRLEFLVEDGLTEPFAEFFSESGSGLAQGTIFGGPARPIAPIAPGQTASVTLTVNKNQISTSQYFSYATMVIPSNDAFIANDNPLEHKIFDRDGNFIPTSFVVTGAEVNDAGTEVNDENPTNTAFFGQQVPNTGIPEEEGVVLQHPGFIQNGPILSDSRFINADFTVPGYQIARITIEKLA
ncbi:MAG: spondin domain-containing protein [Nostoc sp. DedQUE01]|nr:spondin domain-containing protein [Nostoc sp. DedQUE01]